MSDYSPVDLSEFHNVGHEVLQSPIRPPVGELLLRGIPFRTGSAPGAYFVSLGVKGNEQPLRLEFDEPVRTVLVAHLLVDSSIPAGGPIGLPVAEYVIALEDGNQVNVTIRELFEIAALPRPDLSGGDAWAWRRWTGTASYQAAPDAPDGLYPRWWGPWSHAGRRMMEGEQTYAEGYRLWAWRASGSNAKSLEIRPSATPFIIAGITVGHIDEDPIIRSGREPVVITLLDEAPLAKKLPEVTSYETPPATGEDELELAVDRGVATYTWPALPGISQSLADPVRGWGQPSDALGGGKVYSEVAATPSATLEVRRAGEVLGTANWGEVISTGAAVDPGRIRIEWVDRARHWVHTTVMDADTGRPVPCRIHFRSAAGVPWQPHGHHNHVNADLPSWHMDVGGDVRLGAITYAVIDGKCQGWLPEGEILVEVARGFEYQPIRQRLQIRPGQRELQLSIKRWTHERRENWISGDTHVHFLSVDGAHLEAASEDVHVVNILQAQWGHLFTNTEDFTGRPSVRRGNETIVFVGQENRQHVLGHLGLLGLRRPVMPWSSDGPREGEIGGILETTLSDWADEGRINGALVTLAHFGHPNGEAATLIATARVDAVEMIWLGRYFHHEYYRYLNAGYRLPLVGGTDKMSSEVPVGIYRTYAKLDPEEPITYAAWKRSVIRGRTYLSAGPILRLVVEGSGIGDTIRMPKGGGTVDVHATAESAAPFESLQLVVGGEVVAEETQSTGVHRLEIRDRLRVPGDSWIALRAGGPNYFDARRTLCSFERGVFAHTSPIYLRTSENDDLADGPTQAYLLTRVDAARSYVLNMAPTIRSGGGGHVHRDVNHIAHLMRPFDEAREKLTRRERIRPRRRG